MSVTRTDTTKAARRVQRGLHSAMSGEQRVELMVRMSEDARDITAAGIRMSHGDWSEKRVRRALLIRIYGADLVERAWGPGAQP